MATTNFSYSNTQVAHGADFADFANNGGHNFRQFVSNSALIRLKITGTSATAQLYGNNTTAAQISVDGGAWVTPTFPGAAAWYFIPIFSGLSDTAHDVRIRSNSFSGLYIDKDNAWQVTGSTPAVALPTGYTTSNQYQLAYTYASSSGDVAGRTGILDYTQRDGGRDYMAVAGYTNIASFAWLDQSVRFKATCTQIDAVPFQNSGSGAIKVYADGVYKNVFNFTPGEGDNFVTLATGLDGSAQHEYTLTFTNNQGSPLNVEFIISVITIGGTVNVTVPPQPKPHDIFFGDSITQGLIGTSGDSSLSWASLLSVLRGTVPHNRGISGSTVTANPGYNPGVNRVSDISAALPTGTNVFILYGTNDMNQVGGGTITPANLQSAYATMLTNILSGLPFVGSIYCLGILNRYDFTQSQIDPWNTAIKNAITSVGSSKISYTSMNGVINTTAGVDTSDGLHPNQQGYLKIVYYLYVNLFANKTNSTTIRYLSNFTGGI